jgi:hypothetical protein
MTTFLSRHATQQGVRDTNLRPDESQNYLSSNGKTQAVFTSPTHFDFTGGIRKKQISSSAAHLSGKQNTGKGKHIKRVRPQQVN